MSQEIRPYTCQQLANALMGTPYLPVKVSIVDAQGRQIVVDATEMRIAVQSSSEGDFLRLTAYTDAARLRQFWSQAVDDVTDDLDLIMRLLDAGATLLGPLTPELRGRLFAVISEPTQETWNDAHSIVIRSEPRFITLWQAVLAHTDYDIARLPSGTAWPEIPTRTQILAALRAELEKQA